MKIAALDNVVERSGIQNEQAFSIKASGKAFKILSDGLYSNKIGAVIRELSCNAFDSHVAAKKENIPFEIHLPTSLEPWFAVKDTGVGLDHEDVVHLYSTYFESTKNTSNDYVGAFGLGSKSPFCYVDSFSVISIFNGKKRLYSAFISEDGTPKISLLHESETSEDTSFEVQVPVKTTDFTDFKQNAKRFLKYFNPLPKVNLLDIDFEIKEPLLLGNGWRFYLENPYRDRIQLIQGHVAYPLDTKSFGYGELRGHLDKMINGFSIEIDFEIGELEVAANREAVSYNKETVKNIKEKLELVYQDLKKKFQEYVHNLEGTEWEKSIALKKLKSDNYVLFDLFDEKRDLIKNFSIDFKKFKKLTVLYRESGRRRRTQFDLCSLAQMQELFVNPDKDTFFFAEDVKRPKTWYYNYITSTSNRPVSYATIFILHLNGENLNEISEALGHVKIFKTSELERPARQTVGTRDKSIKAFSFRNKDEKLLWYFNNIALLPEELPENALYMETDKNHIIHNGERVSDMINLIRNAFNCGYLKDSEYDSVLLLKKSQLKYLKEHPKWINAKDFILEKAKIWVESNRENYLKLLNYRMNKSGDSEKQIFERIEKKLGRKFLKNSVLLDFINLYKEYSEIKVDQTMQSLMSNLGLSLDQQINENIKDLSKLRLEVYKRYPLIKMATEISYYSISEQNVEALVEYVKLIEGK